MAKGDETKKNSRSQQQQQQGHYKMSAESQEKKQQHHQSSTPQLWQGFVGSGSGIGIDTTTAAAANDATSLGSTAAVQSHNNNYVNFNQFIMQHNFLGSANGAANAHNGIEGGAVGDDLFSNINNSFNGLDNYQQATTNVSNIFFIVNLSLG